MLTITIPGQEFFNESTYEFFYTKECTIQLEHSLVSLSKWESKHHKPFLTDDNKTREEVLDYIKFMTITKNVDPEVYLYLTSENYEAIDAYIENPMTATTFATSLQSGKGSNGEQVTAEIIYYWMIALQVPFECKTWHLNQLLTLIRVCEIKNQPPKKKSKKEILQSNAALNAARRKKYNTKG